MRVARPPSVRERDGTVHVPGGQQHAQRRAVARGAQRGVAGLAVTEAAVVHRDDLLAGAHARAEGDRVRQHVGDRAVGPDGEGERVAKNARQSYGATSFSAEITSARRYVRTEGAPFAAPPKNARATSSSERAPCVSRRIVTSASSHSSSPSP